MWTWCLLCSQLGLEKGKQHNGLSVVCPITILENMGLTTPSQFYTFFHGFLYWHVLSSGSRSSGAKINLQLQIFTILESLVLVCWIRPISCLKAQRLTTGMVLMDR